MTSLAILVMYGWAFVGVPSAFVVLPVRLAVFATMMAGWLFLPFGRVDVPGPLELDKFGASVLPVLACIAVFDTNRLLRFRPALLDVPMLVWLTSPALSSLTNGLGVSDAISESFQQLTRWGIPYLIGRLYITDGTAIRQLALVFFFGAVAYVPFVMWEMRMSPRLHADLYGFATYDHGGFTTRRLGGWRPVVFQQHGLMLGLVMASAAFVGGWMWLTGAWRRFRFDMPFGAGSSHPRWREWSGISRRTLGAEGSGPSFPAWPLVFGLIGIAVLCRALNALVLVALVLGVLMLLRNRVWATRLGLLALLAMPPMYFANRISPDVVGMNLEAPIMELASRVDPERAVSLQVRFDNEYALSSHGMQRAAFGWGGWGRNRLHDEYGNDVTITDGYWIIVLTKHGLYGLLTWYTALVLPVAMMVWRYSATTLASREAAPALALAMVVMMFAVDCIPNAMLTTLHPMFVGGLAALMLAYGSPSRRRVSRGVQASAATGPVGRPSGTAAGV
ncbi:MAG: hypothetical protein AAFR96_04780 [Planctomycetota bacterium]